MQKFNFNAPFFDFNSFSITGGTVDGKSPMVWKSETTQ